MQYAVDAVAHLQPVLERLDVHVRRALLDRALQDEIHQPDDRRLGRQVAQVLDVVLLGGVAVEVLHDRAHRRAAAAVIALDQPVDFRTQAHAQRHRTAGGEFDRLQRVRIGRVGHDQRQAMNLVLYRHHVLLLEKTQRQVQIRRRQFRRVARGQQRHLQQLRPRFGQITLGDQPEPRHQGGQRAFGRFLVQTTGAAQIAVFQTAARHQPCADIRFAAIRHHACCADYRLNR
jgi:hypothetical protein